MQEKADAPAPLTTMRASSMRLPAILRALRSPAEEIMAVPCWSSCITGIDNSFLSVCSMWKHSGALMSSRFIPPKVGAMDLTISMNLSGSFSSISMSNTSIPAYILKRSPFPSITGLPASAPISPNPNTAVPLEITATRLPLEVKS